MAEKSGWRNRIIGSDTIPASEFLANPYNYRIHMKNQQSALKGGLDEIGWIQEVVVNQRTGNLIDGHLRVTLALREGDDTPVPVKYVDLDENEEHIALLTLDPIAAMAATDKDKLDELMREASVSEAALQEMLAELAADAGLDWGAEPAEDPGPQIDKAEELREKWGVESGQLWQLGEHRVICGDCTDADVVAKVMDIPLALMVTDPPYGVDYDPMWRQEALGAADRRTGVVKNDDRSDWLQAWKLFNGDVFYCWSGMLTANVVLDSIGKAEFDIRAEIVWVKDRAPFGRGHYIPNHESCWYSVRHGSIAHWVADKNQVTVWNVATDETVDGGHGTQKPLECMERPIRNHEGDVYDPFLGSGTTLIACERLGRKCRGIEISPAYIAVTLERWHDMTGNTPEMVNE